MNLWTLSTWADLGTIWSGCVALGGFLYWLHTRVMHRIDDRFEAQGKRVQLSLRLAIRAHQRLDMAEIPDLNGRRAWLNSVLDDSEQALL